MKTKIARVRVRSLLGASLSAAVLLTSKQGLAQESINLPQPNQAVALGCVAVTAGDYPQVQLRRNFVDAFDKLDLKSNRWTPHYDAGYDDTAKRWLGYDWVVKRTLPGAQEQQIYVDPDYRGSTSAPLNLNPFTTSNGILTIRVRVGNKQERCNDMPERQCRVANMAREKYRCGDHCQCK